VLNLRLDVNKSAVHGCRVVFRMVVATELLEARLLLEEGVHWTMEPCEPASMECCANIIVYNIKIIITVF